MQHRMLLCNSIKNTSGSARRELEYRKAIQMGEANLYQPVCHLRARGISSVTLRAINDSLIKNNNNNKWNGRGSWRCLNCQTVSKIFHWQSFSEELSHHFTNGCSSDAAFQLKAETRSFTAKHNALTHKSAVNTPSLPDISFMPYRNPCQCHKLGSAAA